MAVFISCLGLFGLAAFTAEQRTKEIGIRKVLGAPVGGLVVLLSRDFLKPVGWAILLATPVGWYMMRGWLQNFAYKIDLGWWPFALAGGLSVVIALLTVGYQTFRVAAANPVASLRNE
jgi:ABC-type antimicrobial peptide transport system permease subunit